MQLVLLIFFSFILLKCVGTVELTFELPDNARECFNEEIEQGVKAQIEFQVVTGGHYDVDAEVEGPNGQVLFKAIKKQAESYSWTTVEAGVYKLCFSNEFSTFSHKLVYFDFTHGNKRPLPGLGEHLTAMTKMETSATNIHDHLNTVIEYQTRQRLVEAQGRKRAGDLNSRVMWWSCGEAILIVVIAIGQVLVLKNFFNEKKGSSM